MSSIGTGRLVVTIDFPIDLSLYAEGTTKEDVVRQYAGQFEQQIVIRKMLSGVNHIEHEVRGQVRA